MQTRVQDDREIMAHKVDEEIARWMLNGQFISSVHTLFMGHYFSNITYFGPFSLAFFYCETINRQ
jgi:hypothetical protein